MDKMDLNIGGHYCTGTHLENDELASVTGTCGSFVAASETEDVVDDSGDGNISVESVGGLGSISASDGEVCNAVKARGLKQDRVDLIGMDSEEQKLADAAGKNDSRVLDATVIFHIGVRRTGKRTHRDEKPSEEERVEGSVAKKVVKKTQTGLRERTELRRPKYLDDYVVNMNNKNGRPIRSSEVNVP